jgi:acyl-CoA synthetase (AMP-forming)/AMP-acid ligase II
MHTMTGNENGEMTGAPNRIVSGSTAAPSTTAKIANVSLHLKEAAALHPYKRAVVWKAGRDRRGHPTYAHLTFRQLDKESDCLAHGLEEAGIVGGTRTILMVRPSPEFFCLIFALFKVGAVPVVVDPGMGVSRMLDCFRESRPEAFIGIPLAHVVRTLRPGFFRSVHTWVTVGSRWFWGGWTLDQIRRLPWRPYPPATTKRDEPAAVLFTTGSTGPAKGAVYTHGNFVAQLHHIRRYLKMAADEIDLSTFPLFALFYPALGVTAVIPDMDPTRPAKAEPSQIIEAIVNQGVTNMFASPALLNRLAQYGKEKAIKMPGLKRVISAGAPVAPELIGRFEQMLMEGAEVHTPYGATEAVPVLSISSKEILSETRTLSERGFGYCVGRPVNDEVEVRIIAISDDPVAEWSESLRVPPGTIGEIVVRGEHVTRHYFEKPQADALAKIADGDRFWHRMGDLGWEDSKGRIWFCGRKSHRVRTSDGTLYTIPCESIYNNHHMVFRSALVGVGDPPNQRPVICVELVQDKGPPDEEKIREDLLTMSRRVEITSLIDTILFHPGFPVDIRHNAKIFREQLAVWAADKIDEESGRR